MRRLFVLTAALSLCACPKSGTTDGGQGGGSATGGGTATGGGVATGGGSTTGGGTGTGGGGGAGGGSATGGGTGTGGGSTMCSNYNPLKNPYFGDLHAHTSYSFDAFTFYTRNNPFDAYAFAKGQTLQVAGAGPDGGGPLTTIARPLDFLAVTDHSEWLALTYGCGDQLDGGPQGSPTAPFYDDPVCVQYRSTDPVTAGKNFRTAAVLQRQLCDDAGYDCAPVVQSAWQAEQAAAAAAYVPCQFTSLVAYEWTHAQTFDAGLGAATLHKNVIFGTAQVPAAPIDAFNYPTQAQLWAALDQQCLADAGCQVITIPHNSNLSQGAAFVMASTEHAHANQYQRLVEVFQHKGGSECYFNGDGGTDPTCDFEYLGGITEPNIPRSYVRQGLNEGLLSYGTDGYDFLQMGFIAATDDHNGTPGNVAENTWPGHAGRGDDTPAQRIGATADGGSRGVDHGHNPGGVAVVWAEQNTRESIFSALYRRETYATSGPRIIVRFYQTWSLASDPCLDPNFPQQLVAAGAVPMGGTFSAAPADAGVSADGGIVGPWLVVYAWKDSVELAEIDLIKGTLDGMGGAKETVTRTLLTAGQPACISVQDDNFNGQPALYYVRVLEQPTPRWSSYDCATDPTLNPAGCADGGYLNTTIQERAWTSPIWYLP